MTRRRLIPMLLPIAVVAAAACGQKSGVEDDADGAVAPPPAATQPPATQPPGETVPPGETTTPGTGGPVATTTGDTAPAVGPYEPGDNDTAGISDTEIVIGIHAPVTGASPIPQTSFDTGKDIYWKFLADSAPDQLFGRQVKVVFRDDEFNPQHATQVCREMVEDDGAFLLIGAGGADQITACAEYANENGIPYLSAGVNESVLTDLDTYFASSLTYAEQVPLLLAEIAEQGLASIGLVVADTPSFDDFDEAFKTAAEEAGLDVVFETRINKEAQDAEALAVVQELKSANADGVVLLSSPLVFSKLAAQAANQSFEPMWLGPGVTSGLNIVTLAFCPSVANALFFNPTPQMDVIDQLDPDFTKAYTQFAPQDAKADDIGLALWALNKALAMMFEATGPDIGRAAFMNTLVTKGPFDNGIYSPLQFTPEDHFGGTGAHLLDADCEAKEYKTLKQFVTVG